MPEQRETDTSSAGRLDDLEMWRLKVFHFVLYLTLGFGFPPLVAWSLSKLQQGRGSVTVPMWVFYAVLIGLGVARKTAFRPRAAAFLTALFASGTVAIFEYGFRGQGPFMYLAVVTMTVVFLGLREAVIVFVVSLVLIAAAGALYVRGYFHDNAQHPLTAFSPWITMIATFVMVGASMLAAVGVLMRRLETGLATERGLVRDLRREVATVDAARAESLRELGERKRTEKLLEQRDRVLHAVGFAAEKLLMSRRWEDCGADVVRAVGEAAGVEHVTLAEVVLDTENRNVVKHRFHWGAPGATHWSERAELRERVSAPGVMDDLVGALHRGDPIQVRIDRMPENARALAKELGLGVATILPISADGKLWGYIGLGGSDPALEIPEQITDLLRAAAGSLGAAIGRDRLNAELEARVTERTERLAQANEEIEAFSYTISHDLRAPLRHVSAYVSMLRDETKGALSEKALGRVKVIADSADRMTQMIDNLLQFYRLGRSSFASTALDLAPVVAEVIAEHEHETRVRDIAWNIGALPELRADRALIKHAFSNLIGNALKYTSSRAHAEIAVGHERHPHEIVVYVRDNGVGFDPSQEHRLFHVFQRLHPLEEFEGSGIGLAHVRRIVERHGGRVWAKGALNVGATFYLAFPANARPA